MSVVPATATNRDLVTMDFVQALDVYTPNFAAELPSHIPVERFKRTIVTAVNLNPDLRQADRRSLFNAAVRCAHDGLYPDGREAALVAYGKQVTYLPMIAGIRKRMRNSGEVLSAIAEVVYRHDHFRYIKGENPHIEHEPPPIDKDRGDPVGAYAIIKLTNGEVLREVMTKADVDKIKAVSRSARNGPWATWPEEMWRKSVLRRCAKQAPANSDLGDLMSREDEPEDHIEPRVIPSRPTREQFIAAADPEAETGHPAEADQLPERYDVVDRDGVSLTYEDIDEAADAWSSLLCDAKTAAEFDAIKKGNGYLYDVFVAVGRDDLETEISQIPRPQTLPQTGGLLPAQQQVSEATLSGERSGAGSTSTVAPSRSSDTPPATGNSPAAGERSFKVKLRKQAGRAPDYQATCDDMCEVITGLATLEECKQFQADNRVTLMGMRSTADAAWQRVNTALADKEEALK
jgi:recombination protein RecT